MQYHPSSITAATTDSLAALLHRAADIAATDPASVDAIAEAAAQLGYSTEAASNARLLACRLAHSRHPHHRVARALTNWAGWQHSLDEPWPVLVDTANHATVDTDWIVTGYWTI
ncbi:hypothetical protein [Gordonia sputi]